MKESLLTKISLIIIFLGFISLVVALQISSVQEIFAYDIMPQDTTISFPAKVTGEYASENGVVLELAREEKITGYFDGNLSGYSFDHEDVIVTGSYDGEWLRVESIKKIT